MNGTIRLPYHEDELRELSLADPDHPAKCVKLFDATIVGPSSVVTFNERP